ncbi:hypothetical protein [Caballeronia arvi]|uniref:hypothetical protein n=1 Tax=Caballeronia arvi TaxID=1777135 RepID=UPI00117C123C|nr:hypothetical protein [Caballeronia arvi]
MQDAGEIQFFSPLSITFDKIKRRNDLISAEFDCPIEIKDWKNEETRLCAGRDVLELNYRAARGASCTPLMHNLDIRHSRTQHSINEQKKRRIFFSKKVRVSLLPVRGRSILDSRRQNHAAFKGRCRRTRAGQGWHISFCSFSKRRLVY